LKQEKQTGKYFQAALKKAGSCLKIIFLKKTKVKIHPANNFLNYR